MPHMPLDHKINTKWNLGFCTNLLESFSSGNKTIILTPKQAVKAIELGNLCKLDGLRRLSN